MVNINAQEYINKKYPLNGVCKSNSDKENKDKRRDEITELDLSKGKVGKGFLSNDGKTLIGSLKLEGFTNLQKLIIFSHQITSLDVSNCLNLEELDCHGNEFASLNVTGCSNLKKVNCSNNPLHELDLSTCNKLEEVNINNCPKLTENTIKSDLNYNIVSSKLTKVGSQITKVEDNDIRNILIIGITGNGKSTLANVVSETNEFTESSGSTAQTVSFQKSDIFKWQGKRYCVIDNIGFGDTSNLFKEEILFKIGEGIYSVKEGLNQVFFVVKGRFSPEQIVVFKQFEDFISETGIAKFTTIVRTNFPNFRDKKRCKKESESLLNQNEELKKIIESCNGILYVDNPPMSTIEEDDSEEEKEEKELENSINQRRRKESRKIVLEHLEKNCQEIYKLKEWDDIYSMMARYKVIEKNLVSAENGKEKLEKEKSSLFKELRTKLGLSVPGLPISANVEVNVIKY